MSAFETIITTLVFAVGGVMVNFFQKNYVQRSKNSKSDYEFTIFVLIHSIGVLVINIFILKYIFRSDLVGFQDLLSKLMVMKYFFKYTLLTIGSSFFYTLLLEVIHKYLFLPIYNKYKESKGLTKETIFPTVWEEIFENPDESVNDLIMTIEKDGVRITQGILISYSAPNNKREIMLKNTNDIKLLMDEDKEFTLEEKMFRIIKKEYYDVESGTLYKFYDGTEFFRYVGN